MNRTAFVGALGAVVVSACSGAAGAATTFELYRGTLQEQGGRLVATGEFNTEGMVAYFTEVFGLYEPWAGERAAQLANGIVSFDSFSIDNQTQIDDTGNFGGIGDSVTFNPLATGGTADIETGGLLDLIGDSPTHKIEIVDIEQISADVDPIVFRQEFGPVKATRLEGNSDAFEFFFGARNPWDTELLNTDGSSFTRELSITFTVDQVPAPTTAAAALVAGSVLVRRRR